MVSQAVVIGAASAGGTFVLLCVGAIAYYCCCSKKHTGMLHRVARKPGNKISTPNPPNLDMKLCAMSEYEGGHGDSMASDQPGKVYPPMRGSITLPALSRPSPQQQRQQQKKQQAKPARRFSQSSLEARSNAIEEEDVDDDEGRRMTAGSQALGRNRRLRSKEYDAMTGVADETLDMDLSTVLGSMAVDKEGDAPYGKLQFKLEFIRTSCSLRLHLCRASNLPAMDTGGTSDPFVKVSLIDTQHVTAAGKVLKVESSWKTKPHRKTLNPEFDVYHDMVCPPSVPLQRLGLLMQVYDHDRVARNEIMGHVWVTLRHLDLGSVPTLWRPLEKGKEIHTTEVDIALGELQVALGYGLDTHKLTVLVQCAKKLPKTSMSKPPDPFAKVRLIHDGCKIASKDFKPEQNDQNPTFNKTVHFTLDADTPVSQCALVVAIWHHEGMNSSPIGVVNFGKSIRTGQDASGQLHWNDMLLANGELISKSHRLYQHNLAAAYTKKKKKKVKSES